MARGVDQEIVEKMFEWALNKCWPTQKSWLDVSMTKFGIEIHFHDLDLY